MTPAYRWIVLSLTLVMQMLVIGIGMYCFTFFAVAWVDEFATSRSQLMMAFAGMTVMAALLSPFGGMLIDSFPARRLVMAGIALYSLGFLLISQATQAWAVIAVFTLLMPMAVVLTGPLMSQSLVARVFEEKRGTAIGICALGTSLGGFVMPPLLASLLAVMDWRIVAMLVAGVIGAGLLPLAFLILGAAPRPRPAGERTHGARSSVELIRNPDVLKLAIAYAIPAALFSAVLQNMGLYARDLSVSQPQAGFIVSITAILMAGGKLSSGFLADRISQAAIYYTLTGLAGAGILLTALASDYPSLAAGVFLLGTTAGGLLPLIIVVASQRFGSENFGRVMGLIMAVASLSGLAPLFAGWIRDLSGSYQPAFMLLLPLLLLAAFCFYRLTKETVPIPSSQNAQGQ